MMFRRRRAAVGAFAAGALILTGCTVPGQEGAPSTAVEYEGATITNERVSDLYNAWTQEGHANITRRGVATLEVLREPMLDHVLDAGLGYSRDGIEDLAAQLKTNAGVEGAPSDEFVDGLESAYLLGLLSLTDQTGEQIRAIATDVEESAVASPRTGDFSTSELVSTVGLVSPAATNRINANDPGWVLEFSGVNAFVEPDADWIASE